MKRPYSLAALFVQTLLFFSVVLMTYSKLLGIVLFIVYVGGLLVLLSYCVMLLPVGHFNYSYLVITGCLLIGMYERSCYCYGLILRSFVLFLGFLLYLVMLCVVEVVDYSRGSLKNG